MRRAVHRRLFRFPLIRSNKCPSVHASPPLTPVTTQPSPPCARGRRAGVLQLKLEPVANPATGYLSPMYSHVARYNCAPATWLRTRQQPAPPTQPVSISSSSPRTRGGRRTRPGGRAMRHCRSAHNFHVGDSVASLQISTGQQRCARLPPGPAGLRFLYSPVTLTPPIQRHQSQGPHVLTNLRLAVWRSGFPSHT